MITTRLGTTDWATDLSMLSLLRDQAEDAALQREWEEARLQCKRRLAAFIEKTQGVRIPAHFLFDVMVKRIHEYKRQLLDVMYCIYRYQWIKSLAPAERKRVVPRAVIFGGKAAPSYHRAKNVIKLINNVSAVVNADKEVEEYLKVVFLPDYSVSIAELVIPAADITQHISTAGTEASGTRCLRASRMSVSNMKSALNGGLLVGTYDGATIEILQAIGAENAFVFGHSDAEIAAMRRTLKNGVWATTDDKA